MVYGSLGLQRRCLLDHARRHAEWWQLQVVDPDLE
jgi:hypothetical protein